MTDQEVEKMLDVTLYRLGLDARARFYAQYLWWTEGEQAADEWIRRYKGGSANFRRHSHIAYNDSPEKRMHDEAEAEMERFYRKEQAPRENSYGINYRVFEADARWALAMMMLEVAGFPARSEQFAGLERQAVEKLRERDRYYYLAYLDAQAAFEAIKKQIKGDGAEPTATGAKIAERNKQG